MAPEDRHPGFSDFDARLRRLRGEDGPEQDGKGSSRKGGWAGYAAGWQAGIEILGGLVGGALIGYGLDYLLGTAPWLLVVFLFLGAAGGLRNAYRRLVRFGEAARGDGDDREGGDRRG